MKNRHHIFFAALMLCANGVFAQQTKVAARTDRNSILIGEQFKLFLEADIPETAPIRFFRIDSIDHFEFIEKQKIDTLNTSDGTILKQVLILTSFDSGSYAIPPLVLDAESGIQTDSIPIDVGFSPFDTAMAYHDVKDIIEADTVKKKADWTWFIIASLAVVGFFLFLVFRKKKKPVVVKVAEENIFDKTLKGLDEIKRENLPAKEFYIAITDLFRTYLDKRFNIHSEQVTTGELMITLKSMGIEPGLHKDLSESLRISDFVKFAKHVSSDEEEQAIYTQIRETVVFLEKEKEQKERRE